MNRPNNRGNSVNIALILEYYLIAIVLLGICFNALVLYIVLLSRRVASKGLVNSVVELLGLRTAV